MAGGGGWGGGGGNEGGGMSNSLIDMCLLWTSQSLSYASILTAVLVGKGALLATACGRHRAFVVLQRSIIQTKEKSILLAYALLWCLEIKINLTGVEGVRG